VIEALSVILQVASYKLRKSASSDGADSSSLRLSVGQVENYRAILDCVTIFACSHDYAELQSFHYRESRIFLCTSVRLSL
jgi:hypothetical protein